MSKEIVALEGAHLAVGESMMTQCPFCLATERKLAVTRYADGIGYICFRASCGARGSTHAANAALPGTVRPKPAFEPKPYVGELTRPQVGDYAAELLGRCGISCSVGETYGVKTILGGFGVYYELRNYRGVQCGWQTRTRSKYINTQALLEGPVYGYYDGESFSIWIVEDPLSAIRLADTGHAALALIGTNLPEGLDFLKYFAKVYVALDPGAEESARKIVRKLRTEGKNAVMVCLPDDIHRLSPETFETLTETYS